MPEFDLYTWFGMFAPAGTPPEAVARLQREVVAGLKSPDVLERFAAVGAEPVGSTPGRVRRAHPLRRGEVGRGDQDRQRQGAMMRLLDAPLAIVDLETTGSRPGARTASPRSRCSRSTASSVTARVVDPGQSRRRASRRRSRRSPASPTRWWPRAPRFAAARRASCYERLAGPRLRRAQRALRLRLPAPRVRARRPQVPARRRCAPCACRAGSIPAQARHDLDSLIARHGIDCRARHRAAAATPTRCGSSCASPRASTARRCSRSRRARSRASRRCRRSSSARAIDAMPEAPGVYLFYGEGGDAALRRQEPHRCARACCSTFTASSHEHWIARRVRRIDWQRTAGELGALLREARAGEGARAGLQPPAARARGPVRLRLRRPAPAPRAARDEIDGETLPYVYGVFRSKRAAHAGAARARRRASPVPAGAGIRVAAAPQAPASATRSAAAPACAPGRESVHLHHARLAAALAPWKAARLAARRAARHRRARPRRRGRPRSTSSTAGATSARRAPTPRSPSCSRARRRGRFDYDHYRILARHLGKPRRAHRARSPPDALRADRPGAALPAASEAALPCARAAARARPARQPASRSTAGAVAAGRVRAPKAPLAAGALALARRGRRSRRRDAGRAPTRCTCACCAIASCVVPGDGAARSRARKPTRSCAALNRALRRCRRVPRARSAALVRAPRERDRLPATAARSRLPGATSRSARGDEALLTEIQMLLHAHPVNEAREARGEPAVNSLWLWGAGRAAGRGAGPLASVAADDPSALGLARLAGMRRRALPGSARTPGSSGCREDGRHLACSTRCARRALEQQPSTRRRRRAGARWFAPLLAALRAGRIGMVTLHVPDAAARRFETMRGDLRRFWRRPQRRSSSYA